MDDCCPQFLRDMTTEALIERCDTHLARIAEETTELNAVLALLRERQKNPS